MLTFFFRQAIDRLDTEAESKIDVQPVAGFVNLGAQQVHANISNHTSIMPFMKVTTDPSGDQTFQCRLPGNATYTLFNLRPVR
jgi:hypothetical protein